MVVLETNLRRTEGKCVLQKKELLEKVQHRRSCKMKVLKYISKRKVTGKKFQNSKFLVTKTARENVILEPTDTDYCSGILCTIPI